MAFELTGLINYESDALTTGFVWYTEFDEIVYRKNLQKGQL